MDNTTQSFFAIGVAVIFSFILMVFFKSWLRHEKWRVGKSLKLREKLMLFENNGSRIAYLRKIDPFLFEELILTGLEAQGYKVVRNSRYTGDGGIDGKAFIDGQEHYIQAKRYQGYINKRHVEDFEKLCEQDGKKGFFIHTGKTGKHTRALNLNCTKIVSGSALIDLILSNKEDERK